MWRLGKSDSNVDNKYISYGYYSASTHKNGQTIDMEATKITANNLIYNIIDSDVMGNFVCIKAPLTEIEPDQNTVRVAIPDSNYIT